MDKKNATPVMQERVKIFLRVGATDDSWHSDGKPDGG
jgi:hypothetical protein